MNRLRALIGPSTLPLLVGLAVSGIAFRPTLGYAWRRLDVVRGWEAESIAQAILAGHGFSFSGASRWHWEAWNGDPNTFHPTAWMDPVFTYLLAAIHWLFGDAAFAVVYLLNFACIGITAWCCWHLARRFAGPWAGALAIVLLAANRQLGISIFDTINNTAFSMAVVAAGALVAVRWFEQPGRARLVALGLFSGFMVLSVPATQYFLPLLAAGVALRCWSDRKARWRQPLVALLLAAAVIAPWTIRNYVVFDEFVPVRNGAGQIIWEDTVGIVSTFAPEKTRLALPAPWQSRGPRDAVQQMLVTDNRVAMHKYEFYTIEAAPPPGWHEMNEAQRDKFYLEQGMALVRAEPLLAAQLAIAKLEAFLFRMGIFGAVVIALALIGALLLLRDRRSWPLLLMSVAYVAPFVLAIAYFARYLTPIMPVFAVLAAAALVTPVLRVLAARSAAPA